MQIGARTTLQQQLAFYSEPTGMTAAGQYAPMLADLPSEPAALAAVVQGLLLYEYVAEPFYGVRLLEERQQESHLRSVEALLDRLLSLDGRPLSVARPLEQRLVGVCHHFALLPVAILRAQGLPARARCGFGSYFNPGYFEDHWVFEYWSSAEERWVRLDAQLDEVWRTRLGVDFDPLDVPGDRFLVAGEAWAQCRAGAADPAKFGIFKGDLRGLWFIASDVLRDLAALNKMEPLPWDVWGAMPAPNQPPRPDQLALFDRLARFSRAPDAAFDELRALYQGDERVRMPAVVHNALLNRAEPI
jgi:transglutaminase superfamily protein